MDDSLATTSAILLAAEIRKKQAAELKDDLGLDPIFSQQTPPAIKIEKITQEVIETCLSLKKFAQWNPYLALAGLAANQIGIRGERCLLNVCFVNIDTKEFGHKDWVVAVNPEIISKTNPTFDAWEGCLTWPKMQIRAVRYSGVTVRYTTLEGVEQTREATDFEAQVWQHEINHLNGVPEDVRDPAAPITAKPNDPCPCGKLPIRKFKKCCGR